MAAQGQAYNLDINERGSEAYNATQRLFQALVPLLRGDDLAQDERDGLVQIAEEAAEANELAGQAADRGMTLARTEQAVPVLTRMPNFNRDNLVNEYPDLRNKRIKDFSGSEGPEVCRTWLAKLMNTANLERLSEQATINMLHAASYGRAGEMINNAMARNHTLEQIVRELETAFGNVLDPETAKQEIETFSRKTGENILEVSLRIETLAKMACRFDINPEAAIERTCRDTLFKLLHPEVTSRIINKESLRKTMGQEPFNFTDLKTQTEQIERQVAQLMRKSSSFTMWKDKSVYSESKPSSINMISDNTETTIDTNQGEEEEDIAELINFIRAYKKQPRNFRRPFRSSNSSQNTSMKSYKDNLHKLQQKTQITQDINQVETRSEDTMEQLKAEGIFEVAEGILHVPDGRGAYYQVRYKDLNVSPLGCWKCGDESHQAFGKNKALCPYKAYPLVKKCTNCNIGGHAPSLCIRSPKNE